MEALDVRQRVLPDRECELRLVDLDPRRLKLAQQRQRLEIVAQDLDELGRTMAAVAARTPTRRVFAFRAIFDAPDPRAAAAELRAAIDAAWAER